MTKTAIITGAMGFIGSHTAKVFKQNGYRVIGIDYNDTVIEAEQFLDQWFDCDYQDIVASIAYKENVECIIHCAGTSLVGPSMSDPGTYYENNTAKTNRMMQDLTENDCNPIVIFSSSAAVYGFPLFQQSLKESYHPDPRTPYGMSKLFCERVINDHCQAHKHRAIALRYFNAAGCDPENELGHVGDDTHLIPRILSAYQKKEAFGLYGDNYVNEDGTCIRDYVHVTDIARAHLLAVNLALRSDPGTFQIHNLGTGRGYSNLEVIRACEETVGDRINYEVKPPRPGDPPYLVANGAQFQRLTGWKPVLSDISNITKTAWAWQSRTYGNKNFDLDVAIK